MAPNHSTNLYDFDKVTLLRDNEYRLVQVPSNRREWAQLLLSGSQTKGKIDDGNLIFPNIDSGPLKLLAVLYICLFALTIIGNSIVLIVVISRSRTGANGWAMLWKSSHQWTPHRSPFLVLQASMAVTDLCVGFVCIPVVLSELLYGYHPFHGAMCKIYVAMQGTTRAANTWFVCAICLHRYLQTTNPRLLCRYFTQKHALVAVALIWLTAVAVSIPAIITTTEVVVDHGSDQILYCEESWTNKTVHLVYAIAMLVVLLILPSLLLIVCYSRLIVSIRNLADYYPINRIRLRFRGDDSGTRKLLGGVFVSAAMRSQLNPTTGVTNVLTNDIPSVNQRDLGDVHEISEPSSSSTNRTNRSVGTCQKSIRECLGCDDFDLATRSHHRRQKRAIKLLITISVCFILSWTPYYLISTVNIIRDSLPYHAAEDNATPFEGSVDNNDFLSFDSKDVDDLQQQPWYLSETAESLNTVMVVVSYALFFGHFHSCHNAIIYLLLDCNVKSVIRNCCGETDSTTSPRKGHLKSWCSTSPSCDQMARQAAHFKDGQRVCVAKRVTPPKLMTKPITLTEKSAYRMCVTSHDARRSSARMPVDPGRLAALYRTE